MKNWMMFCVLPLLLSFFPAKGWAQEECLKKFKTEAAQLSEQYAQLEKQIDALRSRRSSGGETREQQEARLEQINALEKQKAENRKQLDEATKRSMRCLGLPATREEAQQSEAKIKALLEQQKKLSESAAKQLEKYQNLAPRSSGSSGNSSSTSGSSSAMGAAQQGLAAMPPLQEPAAPPSYPSSLPASGSGRTPAQRAAAVAAINAELDRMPYVLPKKGNAPSTSHILKLAGARNALARKNFTADDLAAYSRAVTWIPRFDGLSTDAKKAKDYSLLVSSVTNYFNRPQLIIALASVVFSLDPQSTAGANNLASAIITAGRRLNTGAGQLKEMAPYYTDAETCFLYAIANSMDGGAWTDKSLTSIINLGNLYIDLDKLEEARSLFQVARKQSPYSWDAAQGMAAYFYAVNKPDKALAILEDDNLDRPLSLMIAKKHEKKLEKNDDVPIDAPEQVYKDRIDSLNSTPIETAADFMSQIDQSTRNKLRSFVENLAPKGSFTAPPIAKLTQYASLKAIASPHGISALKDFGQKLQVYSMSSFASLGDQQLKMLSDLGIKLDPGVDLNDVARNPEKYANSKNRPKAKVDKSELTAKIQEWRKQAAAAKRELATGKTASSIALAAQVDPFFAIVQVNPDDYADPMNVIIQKHNFAVYNRKFNLYSGSLYSVNKKRREAVNDITIQYNRKISEYQKIQADALEQLEKRRVASSNPDSVEWKLRKHDIHTQYFNSCNAAAETAFGSATNVASVAYVQKIKPMAEAFYYDVFRHVALISDEEVRKRKDAELHGAIYSALVTALGTVGSAYSSFKYHPEWECACDVGDLLRQKALEDAARDAEENARIQRNKAAKAAFESGEIPESSPLFKRLDAYGFDFDYFFWKGHISCAYTQLTFNWTIPIPGAPTLTLSQKISEFTGAGIYDQGISLGFKPEIFAERRGLEVNLSLSSSVTMDGKGVVKDYSITAGTGLKVTVGSTGVTVGGQMTFGPGGIVRDSDFSAGIKTDFPIGKNLTGEDLAIRGSVSLEASTKLGCSLSSKVDATNKGLKNVVEEGKNEAFLDDRYKNKPEYRNATEAEQRKMDTEAEKKAKKDAGLLDLSYLYKKSLWSRKFELSKPRP